MHIGDAQLSWIWNEKIAVDVKSIEQGPALAKGFEGKRVINVRPFVVCPWPYRDSVSSRVDGSLNGAIFVGHDDSSGSGDAMPR